MIAILLCTYNGEKYLSEQIESILAQSYTDYTVYIHDDGSKDKTLSIIEEYASKFPRKVVHVKDCIAHRGASKSFFYLLERIQADYYMFCDQDDVWLPTKIEHTFAKMKECEMKHSHSAILVHTDLYVCDSELNIIYDSFWTYRHLLTDLCKDFKYLCFGNIVTGCTMMINRLAKDVALPYSDETYLHDYWIALKVAKYGYLDNIKEQTILYRQHGDNAAGIGSKFKWGLHFKSFYQWWKDERPIIKKLGYGNDMKLLYYRLIYFYKRYIS